MSCNLIIKEVLGKLIGLFGKNKLYFFVIFPDVCNSYRQWGLHHSETLCFPSGTAPLFIQPLFYSKPKMTLKEDIILQKKWDFHFGISEAVKDSVKELRRCAAEISRTYEYIFDLSSIFDASDEQIYFDICHVLDKGNAIIADEIYEIIQKRM